MHAVPWFLAAIPMVRADMLARPAAIELLDSECERKRAILVAAPSGYGKTVALSQWAARRAAAVPGLVAWLTLTVRVADRADVLRGLLTALDNAARSSGDDGLCRQLTEVAEVLQASSYQAAVAALMQIDPLTPVTVVIDDFQQARAARHFCFPLTLHLSTHHDESLCYRFFPDAARHAGCGTHGAAPAAAPAPRQPDRAIA